MTQIYVIGLSKLNLYTSPDGAYNSVGVEVAQKRAQVKCVRKRANLFLSP